MITQPKAMPGPVGPLVFGVVSLPAQEFVHTRIYIAARHPGTAHRESTATGLSHCGEGFEDLGARRRGEVCPFALGDVAVDPGQDESDVRTVLKPRGWSGAERSEARPTWP